jgi:methyl-accepting chemotaxis protein
MKKRSTLERQMFTYFGLIAAASLLITGEFVWAIQAAMTKAQALSLGPALVDSPVQAIILELTVLRNKAFLMCAVQAVITLIVLIMFLRRITGPLQKLIEYSRLISEGDFSQTIEVRRKDEIGLLGDTINDLTANNQEIVAYGLAMEQSLRPLVEELHARAESDPHSREQIDEVAGRLTKFKDFLETFKLFSSDRAMSGTEWKP